MQVWPLARSKYGNQSSVGGTNICATPDSPAASRLWFRSQSISQITVRTLPVLKLFVVGPSSRASEKGLCAQPRHENSLSRARSADGARKTPYKRYAAFVDFPCEDMRAWHPQDSCTLALPSLCNPSKTTCVLRRLSFEMIDVNYWLLTP